MFEIQEKSASAKYTTTVALLVFAFIFSPAILLVSRPVGFGSIALAAAGSIACVAYAWINWRKNSEPVSKVSSTL
jgi:hypothetical protein